MALRKSRGIALLCFQTLVLEGGEGSTSRPGLFLPSGKTRYPLYRRLGGSQGRSGQRKISPHRDSIPGPSSPYSVAIPTELSGPHIILCKMGLVVKFVSYMDCANLHSVCAPSAELQRDGMTSVIYSFAS